MDWDLLSGSPYLNGDDSQMLSRAQMENFKLWLLVADIGGEKVAIATRGNL